MYNRSFLITLIASLFLFIYTTANSQSAPITGTVITPDNLPIELATVSLLNAKDSTLVSYTITDDKGVFNLFEITKDSLLLNIYSMGYNSYYKNIVYKKAAIDLKTIKLEEDLSQLDEVIISAVVPIQVKKDTIAFNASSFKVNPDDNIEGLLKKLPGLDIGTDGKVIAQGNEVTKIYVDGKEFFSGDPAIVLKNLSADEIAKIEIIDKNSDETELTGVDDGNKQIIINLSLKKTKKKNRGFGKLSGGVGLDNRYFSNLNYNNFSKKTQISVIGKFNNINVTGSNIQSFLENADGLTDESDEEDSGKPSKSLSGYLKTGVSGVHYGHEYQKRESFNADYFYNNSENNGVSHSKRINFANINNFDYQAENTFSNITNNHNLNFNYKNQSNKSYSLFIKGKLNADKRTSYLGRDGSYLNDSNELVTTNNNQLENENDKKLANININYIKRLAKKGRSFSTGFDLTSNSSDRDNEQSTFTSRKLNTNNPNYRELETLRDESFRNNRFNFNFKYTEPLGGNYFLRVETSFQKILGTENTNQSKTTITNNTTEDFLSYKYRYTENSYFTKILNSYNTPKLNISIGTVLQDLNRYFGETHVNPITKSQFYVNPTAIVQYRPNRGKKYRFFYRRSIKSPSINQSTTVINNLNPFSIRRGNPELKTEKTDLLQLTANIFELKSAATLSSKIQFLYTQDAIIPNINIDEDFVRTRSYENGGNRKRLNTTLSFSRKISKLGLRYTLKNQNLFSTTNSIVNNILNDVTSKNFLTSFSVENHNKNNFDFKTGASYTINETSFSIINDLDRTYTKQDYFSSFDIDISKKLNFNTQFDYLIFSDNKFDAIDNLPLWNAAVSYAFSKKKNNILKLLFIDLLDKNVDIYRRSTINYFEETTTESLGRYVIMSYTYRLNNSKKRKGKKGING